MFGLPAKDAKNVEYKRVEDVLVLALEDIDTVEDDEFDVVV